MKRLLAALAIACAVGWITPASAELTQWRTEVLKFRTSAANTQGFVDSTQATVNHYLQTTATVDTTVAFDMSRVFLPTESVVNTTVHGLFKVWVSAPTFTSIDTIFIAMETSPDGTNWIPNTTFANMIVTTAGDEAAGLHFQADSDAGNLNAWCAPYVRFRIRCDGNSGATAFDTQLRITFPSRE